MITTFRIFENVRPSEELDPILPQETETEFWLVDYYVRSDYEHSYSLFSDEESAKNYIISVINDERMSLEESLGEEYTEDMYFVDIDEALKWYNDNFDDVIISYQSVRLSKEFKGDKKFQLMKNAKKYNL